MKVIYFTIISVLLFACTSTKSSSPQKSTLNSSNKKTVREVAPMTHANIEGHKELYKEGWLVVSSSEKAFLYAEDKAIRSSGEALAMAKDDIKKRSVQYKEEVIKGVEEGSQTRKKIHTMGSETSSRIYEGTDVLIQKELRFAKKSYQAAWSSVTKGNLSIVERTEEDRAQIKSFGNYTENLKSDFSNIDEIAAKMDEDFSVEIKNSWNGAFEKGVNEFNKEYEESGESSNSLSALGDILQGYLKSLYYSIIEPSVDTVTETGKAAGSITRVGTKKVAKAIFLPVAKATVITGRTVQSTGMTLYYTGKIGVKLMAPYVESGFLSGLALLSYASIPLTYVGGKTAGAINQVAFSTSGAAMGTGETVAKTVGSSVFYAALVTYDAMKGVTKVVINYGSAGVVLGYNALTAIPTHLVLGTFDAIALVYEGPKLVIVGIKGGLKSEDGEVHSAQDLPVGTVLDLNALKKTEGIEIQVISKDPEVIQNVIQKSPNDLRINKGVHEAK